MKILLITIFLLLIAFALGVQIQKDPGYVLISLQNWSIETSMWTAVAALLILFFLFYLLLRTTNRTAIWSLQIRHWREKRNFNKAKQLANFGLCELAAGNWKIAERSLIKSAKQGPSPLINYLGAARAAQAQQAYKRRDQYLQKAHESTDDSELAVGITQAQLQISSQQWQDALTTLVHLQKKSPKHPYILALLKEVCLQLQDFQQLENILPQLRKQHILPAPEQKKLEHETYLSALTRAAHSSEANALTNTWLNIPKYLREQPSLISQYAHYLCEHHQDKRALSLIESTLKKHWHADLVTQYGLLVTDDLKPQLNCAEKWLKSHPNDPDLLLCLGRLCIKLELWSQAKEHLQKSLKIALRTETYQVLGQALEGADETQEALACYRQGFELANRLADT